ncbi:MAG: lactonase family protein [Chloroflexota bacterium]
MQPNDTQESRHAFGSVSRRVVLAGAAVLAVGQAVPAFAQAGDDDAPRPRQGKVLAYAGTYTPNGQGIYLFQVDLSTGALDPVTVFPSSTNPSWMEIDPSKTHLYAVDEISNYNGTTTGAASAYSIDRSNGNLTLLNTVSSQGSGPAHLSVDPLGKYVFVANYGGGSVAVLPIQSDGSLGNATDMKSDAGLGPVGPTRAAKAPPGSFAISGHDAPHAHFIHTDPAGKFVIANDLGLDLTIVWSFDRSSGTLSNPRTFPSSPGAGPRHFVFHPNGRFFYLLTEEASTVEFRLYDPASGTLGPIQQEIQTLPANFVGTTFGSEIRISDDGRFVYCANRLHDTVATFAVGRDGRLTWLGEEWTRGDYPRSFTIEPTGRFLYACNQRGDSITAFRVIGGGRQLSFTERYTAVGSPAIIIFLEI